MWKVRKEILSFLLPSQFGMEPRCTCYLLVPESQVGDQQSEASDREWCLEVPPEVNKWQLHNMYPSELDGVED